jgi:hypothetical protein
MTGAAKGRTIIGIVLGRRRSGMGNQTGQQQSGEDVTGHGYRWSDEDLKQAITRVESALEALRSMGADQDAEVEGHVVKWSDEDLKQAVRSLTDALESLKAIQANSRS